MRTLCVVFFLSCGPAITLPPDAGRPFGPDGGISCEPADTFCVNGAVWQCTLSGYDAVMEDDCTRTIAAMRKPGTCSPSPCGAGQEQHRVGAVYCCVNL
jgi:hypothetical protein